MFSMLTSYDAWTPEAITAIGLVVAIATAIVTMAMTIVGLMVHMAIWIHSSIEAVAKGNREQGERITRAEERLRRPSPREPTIPHPTGNHGASNGHGKSEE